LIDRKVIWLEKSLLQLSLKFLFFISYDAVKPGLTSEQATTATHLMALYPGQAA